MSAPEDTGPRFLPSVDRLEASVQGGRKAFEAGRYDEALRAFNEALRLKPEYDVAWILRGHTLRRMGDADGALQHMASSIHFLRLRQTVSQEELKTTLQGYFDKPGFGEAQLADVLDTGSVFVQPAASPVEDVTGEVFELNVKSRQDMSASIPFWSDYQKYYFVQDGSNWLIFAIL